MNGLSWRGAVRARPGWAAAALWLAANASAPCQLALPPGAAPPPSFAAEAEENPARASILVLYNANQPASRALAQYYARQRGIAPERLLGLKCSSEEEISRDEYDATIAEPLRAAFDVHQWWARSPEKPDADPASTVVSNKIRFLAVIRGVPLKIRQTDDYPGDVPGQPAQLRDRNDASVDSELCTLGFVTRHISGARMNPYFHSFRHIDDFPVPGLLLATRLDGPSDDLVRRMIDDALAAEREGLWGRCYVDSRGLTADAGEIADGDVWMRRIARQIMPYTMPTILDESPDLFPSEYPMTQAAMYFGWYAGQPGGAVAASGFRFCPGAVACHLHSYSAASLRDPTRGWVAPLLAKGAAAALGNVYEPFLGFTTRFDLFAERLALGWTLAESAYAATPGLSWQTDVIGDPLYRPGQGWQAFGFLAGPAEAGGTPRANAVEGRAYLEGAGIWHARGPEAGAAALERSAERLHSGSIYEGLGLLEAAGNDLPHACAAFEAAARAYQAAPDAIRALLNEAGALAKAGRKEDAIRVAENGRKLFGTSGAASLFGELAGALAVKTPEGSR